MAESAAAATIPPEDRPRDERDRAHPGWPVVAASASGVFFASLVVVTFPVFLKPWSEAFSWTREEISRAFAIAALVAGFCAAPMGGLLDRIGARRVVVPCLAVFGALFASLSFMTPSLVHLYATFVALGLFGIGTSPVAYARAVSTWFVDRRGLALALLITGGAIGGVLHPPIATVLVERVGWRGAFLALGLATLAIGVPLVARFVRERPGAVTAAAAHDGAMLGEGLRARAFWTLALVQLGATMLQNAVLVHLAALLTDRGVPLGRAALVLSAMAVAAVAGRVVTGLLLDRVLAPRLLLLLLALASGGAFLLAGSTTFGAAMAAAILVGFGIGGEADVVPYLLTRYFGLRAFSTLYGLVWTANAIGGAMGPILMGRAFDVTGSYAGALGRLGFVVLAAAALALTLPRYGARDGVSAARP